MKTEEEIKKEIEMLEKIKKENNYGSISMLNSYIVALEWVLDND